MSIDLILSIVYTQIVLIPILGAIYLATKSERKRISVIQAAPKVTPTGFKEFLKDISRENKRTLRSLSHIKTPSRVLSDGNRGRNILSKLQQNNRKPWKKKNNANRTET